MNYLGNNKKNIYLAYNYLEFIDVNRTVLGIIRNIVFDNCLIK